MSKPKVFISYSHQDADAAKRLFAALTAMGVDPWLDSERLLPGQHWERAIHVALRAADYVIVLLSSRSVAKRGFLQKEIRVAMDLLDEVPDSQIFLIPARLDGCESGHDRLNKLHWLDLYPSWEEGIARLRSIFSFVPDYAAADPFAIGASDPFALTSNQLVGTCWQAIDTLSGSPYGWKFQCMPDGELRYEDAAIDRYFTNARWRLAGQSEIYMELNGQYVQMRGVVTDREMRGEGRTLEGKEFTWTAHMMDKEPDWLPMQ